jgi:hypothetical protein
VLSTAQARLRLGRVRAPSAHPCQSSSSLFQTQMAAPKFTVPHHIPRTGKASNVHSSTISPFPRGAFTVVPSADTGKGALKREATAPVSPSTASGGITGAELGAELVDN